MMSRLMTRLRGMVSRAVVSLVNDAAKLQALQVTLMADQVPDDAEHFQHYGFSSVAHAGAEGIALAVGGSTGHTVVINVDDRRYRIKNLASGEVVLYDDLGHTVHLTRNGIVINGAGHPVTVNGDLVVNGTVTASGNVTGAGVSLAGHRHGGVTVGGAQTGTPV